jgi:hypothetical protein
MGAMGTNPLHTEHGSASSSPPPAPAPAPPAALSKMGTLAIPSKKRPSVAI